MEERLVQGQGAESSLFFSPAYSWLSNEVKLLLRDTSKYFTSVVFPMNRLKVRAVCFTIH